MCQLQEIHHACGHIRKVLLSPCKTQTMLGPVPKSRVPDFCLNGLEIVQTIDAEHGCGRGQDGLTCRQVQAVVPLEERFAEMQKVLNGYDQRVQYIREVRYNGIKPRYDIERLKREGYNLGTLCLNPEIVYEDGIPMFLQRWTRLRAMVDRELRTAFEINAFQIHSKVSGKAVLVESDVESSTDDEGRMDVEEWPNSDLAPLELAFEKADWELHEVLNSMEYDCVLACLDAVGWGLPEDETDRRRLEEAVHRGRLVQPLCIKSSLSEDSSRVSDSEEKATEVDEVATDVGRQSQCELG